MSNTLICTFVKLYTNDICFIGSITLTIFPLTIVLRNCIKLFRNIINNYTYVGSTWGKIVDAIMTAKCMNPIIYIDELDKISNTEHGREIIGILIHLTDPAQNEEFTDRYFSGIHIDLSKCLIIFSYNDASKVDRILLDRIHRIKTKPLDKYEKTTIIQEYVLPEMFDVIGFNPSDIILEEEL